MLLKSCSRCGKLIPYGKTRCESCEAIVQKIKEGARLESKRAADRVYNKKRDSKYGHFYNSKDWRTLARKRIQQDRYRCVKCGQIATEVDHIIPIQTPDGWNKRFDIDNLQSLCRGCHNAKHNRFRGGEGGGRRRRSFS